MTPHILIPITEIDTEALPRDRTQLDEDAMAELTTSIATSGLRMPVEVWKLSQPTDQHRYGLISGLRRLTAHQRLATLRQNGTFTEIAAFLRTPETIPQAMADMVAENEIRSETSPWEKGATLLAATRAGIFDTLDNATQTLHASASRQKRARLRAFAEVVEDLEDAIATPERLTGRQMHRLSAALRAGLSELMHLTLRDHRRADRRRDGSHRTLFPTPLTPHTPSFLPDLFENKSGRACLPPAVAKCAHRGSRAPISQTAACCPTPPAQRLSALWPTNQKRSPGAFSDRFGRTTSRVLQ